MTKAMKSVFYGSLYNNEVRIYHTKVEEQFRACSEKMRKENMEVVTWGFDVLVKDPSKKKEIESWVRRCAEKYFPGVPHVEEANQKNSQ